MKNFILIFLLFGGMLFAQEWQVVGNMPEPVSGGEAVVHDSLIFILGGFSDKKNSSVTSIWAYNPRNNTWKNSGNMKVGRQNFIAGSYNGNIIYFGGAAHSAQDASSLELWNDSSNPSVFGRDNMFNRSYATGQIIGSNLYVFGGNMMGGDSDYLFVYNLDSSKVSYSARSVFGQFSPLSQMSVAVGNKIFIFGGALGVLLKSVYVFDISNHNFSKAPVQLSTPRASGAAVYADGKIYIIGGVDETNEALSSVDVLNVNGQNGEAEDGPELRYSRSNLMAVNYYGTIYVFGGDDKDGQPVPQVEKLTVVTGINDAGSTVPKSFSLEQNYPNPFNPSTVIEYRLSSASAVNIRVYDELGREITTLVNKRQAPGNYSVTFNGSGFSSGIYFYRLQAGNFISTKKMMLVK